MKRSQGRPFSRLPYIPFAAAALAAATIAVIAPARAGDVDAQRLLNADNQPADWLTYHGTYKSWHYSGLDQINANNVKDLKVAWSHVTPRSTRGLQSFPLVVDGVLYYTGSHNQLFALDGATGNLIWAYKQKLNEDLVGKLVAVDMNTGKLKWETKLVESEKLTVGFTGAPLLVKDKVIIGSQGGEWPYRGPIFGVDAKTGQKVWEFYTVAGTPDAEKTWGNESWRTGGGGGWMPGNYDAETNTVWWGTANPAPLYDWSGA